MIRMTMMCYVIALLYLNLTSGELYDNIKPQRIAPITNQRLLDTKEFVLNLTFDQIQALQSSGIVVKPFIQSENVNKPPQQSIERNTEYTGQTISSNEKQKSEEGLDKIYKILNIHHNNETLGVQQRNTENASENNSTEYTYKFKPSQEELTSSFIPIRNSRTGSHSSEHITNLSNYEGKILRTKPYHAPPSSGNYFEDAKRTRRPIKQRPLDFHRQFWTSNIIHKSKGIQSGGFILTNRRKPRQEPISSTFTLNENVLDTVKYLNTEKIPHSLEFQTPPLPIKQGKESVISPTQSFSISSSAVVQTQYTTLLIPLIQDEKISESIAQRKELVNSERLILQEFKDLDSHDKYTYIAELNKLKQNLRKQNILAEKVALYNSRKEDQEELSLKRNRPEDKVRASEPLQLIISQTNTVPWRKPTATPVPVIQQEKVEQEQSAPSEEEKPITPRARNIYTKANT